MRNEADTPTQHEQSVQDPHLHVLLCLLGAEGAAVAHEIDKADGHGAVDVEDQIVFLGGGDCFDGDGVVEHFAAGEVLLHEFLDQFDAEIRVVAGFDFVADAGDCGRIRF